VWNRTQSGDVKKQKLHLKLLNVLNKLDILLESRPLTSEEFSSSELERIQHLEETI